MAHRGHVRVEDRIREGKDCGLRNLPFRSFAHNHNQNVVVAGHARPGFDHRYTPEPHQQRTPAWREHYRKFPTVLVVLARPHTISREQRERDRDTLKRRMQNTIALHQANTRAHDIGVLLVLLEDLQTQGPFARIFIDPARPDRYLDWLGQPTDRERERT